MLCGVCLDELHWFLYVAHSDDRRIEHWSPSGTTGSTSAGIASLNRTSSTLLDEPSNVTLNDEETFLSVSELDNSRVRAFHLI